MSAGSIVAVVLFAGTVLLALEPLRRPRALAVTSYLAALGASELPQLFLRLVLTATVPTIAGNGGRTGRWRGRSSGWVPSPSSGWASWPYVPGARGKSSAGRSLRHSGARSATAPDRPRRASSTCSWRPFPLHPRRVEQIRDLSYGHAGWRNRLDIYRLRSRAAGAPVLVYLHGGGYVSGAKYREARALLHRMAGEGWVCVSANYRLRPRAGFLDHVVDVKKVLVWVREHGPAYGADPCTVVVSGSSAGGHLAALSALTPGEPAYQPGFEHADTTVSAAVCLYGYYGRYYGRSEDEWPPSSPLSLDAAQAPPFFLAHGDLDTYMPVEGARGFAARLRRASSHPVVYAELPGGQHGFDRFRLLRFEAVVDGVAAFLGRVEDRSRYASRAAGSLDTDV